VQRLPIEQQPAQGELIPVAINRGILSLPNGVQAYVPFTAEVFMAQVRIDNIVRASGLRTGAVFSVLWMGRTVAITPTISKARLVARRINAMLRSLGNVDLLYNVSTQQSLADSPPPLSETSHSPPEQLLLEWAFLRRTQRQSADWTKEKTVGV